MERIITLNYEIKHMTKTIICKNCKETKTYHAKGLCKTCYKRQHAKKYNQRPEVKERANANMRRYRTDPKFKAYQERQRQYAKEYRQRPEVKERDREYNQTPRRKKYWKEYYKRLGVKEKHLDNHRRYRNDPKYKCQQEHEKQYRKEYIQRSEVKEMFYQYEQRPERKAYHRKYSKQYRETSKGKKAMQKHNAYINLIYRPTHRNIELMPDVFPDEISTTPHHIKNNINNPKSKSDFYMFLPRITHEYVGGKTRNNEHWYHNAEWIKKLYCMNMQDFLEGNDFMV